LTIPLAAAKTNTCGITPCDHQRMTIQQRLAGRGKKSSFPSHIRINPNMAVPNCVGMVKLVVYAPTQRSYRVVLPHALLPPCPKLYLAAEEGEK
jgi:hypothetical protein